MASFDHIIGNDHIKNYLQHMVEAGSLGNSLLFEGVEGIGKSLFAEALAKTILKTDRLNHPDLYIFRPEGKIGMHSIEAMRQFCEKVYMTPFQARWKVFIIHDAERMLPASANALLKTFEEPSLDSVIILLSSRSSSLLPTVLSRCRTVRFHHVEKELIAAFIKARFPLSEEASVRVASLSGGSIGEAVRLAQEGGNAIREKMLDYLALHPQPTYPVMLQAAREISDLVETAKKQEESDVRVNLLRGVETELTAAQQQNLEKEIDGAVALRQAGYAQSLFEVILSWYRDIHLLQTGGRRDLLINADRIADLEKFAQTKKAALESVFTAIKEAKLLLDRSTGLPIVLENLFLKLSIEPIAS